MSSQSSSLPLFDPATAKPVPPTRHEPTGRTYAFVQGEHLFSATGVFIATKEERETPSQERKNAKLSS